VPEKTELFPNRNDAILYLLGLTGFWGGGAALGIAGALRLPSFVVIGLLPVVLAGAVLIMNATRRLEDHLTGRKVRPWPFGYPRFRTQVKATMPWTIADAADGLGLNGNLTAAGLYVLLVVAVASVWFFAGPRYR
jgi:hypothetical protein